MYVPNTSQNADMYMYNLSKYLLDNGQAITYNIEQLKLYFTL